MMDTSPAGIMVLDRRGQIVYANARLEQILGLKQAALQEMFKGSRTGASPFPGGFPQCHFQGRTGL